MCYYVTMKEQAPTQLEIHTFSVQELIEEGKTEALAQSFLGNEEAMIKIFGKVVTIDEMNKFFEKGVTADQAVQILDVLGHQLLSVDELKKHTEGQL